MKKTSDINSINLEEIKNLKLQFQNLKEHL
ncbi:hypothetical protein ES703_43953 [subsurface metagenome]|jgi:hypothetical protein